MNSFCHKKHLVIEDRMIMNILCFFPNITPKIIYLTNSLFGELYQSRLRRKFEN
jgi:hypothetical protein